MGMVPVLLFAAVGLAGIGLGFFVWAVHSRQFESLDIEAQRALHDAPPIQDEPADE